jgi:N-formylglutamate amidohydrolase
MSTKGMGMFYTHTPDGKLFRIRKEEAYKKALDIYNTYHKRLEEKVENCLAKHGKCIILDCHSFHDEMDYTDYQAETFPDVCIGVNENVITEAKLIIDIFKNKGYSVKVNEPFAGSIVPLKYIDDNRVKSVMIELNRRIYDNNNFLKVQTICKEIYNKLG